jgi:hypothetical protein
LHGAPEAPPAPDPGGTLIQGRSHVEELRVEVRNRFDGSWSSGFALAETLMTDNGPLYRIRRLSDGTELWGLFRPDEVTPEREGPGDALAVF